MSLKPSIAHEPEGAWKSPKSPKPLLHQNSDGSSGAPCKNLPKCLMQFPVSKINPNTEIPVHMTEPPPYSLFLKPSITRATSQTWKPPPNSQNPFPLNLPRINPICSLLYFTIFLLNVKWALTTVPCWRWVMSKYLTTSSSSYAHSAMKLQPCTLNPHNLPTKTSCTHQNKVHP